MRMRFIGRYTNGHNQVTACGITFTGNEPTEVTGRKRSAAFPIILNFKSATRSTMMATARRVAQCPGAHAKRRLTNERFKQF